MHKHLKNHNESLIQGKSVNDQLDRRRFMTSIGMMTGALAASSLLGGGLPYVQAETKNESPTTHSVSKNPKPSVGIEWYNVKDYQVKGDGKTNDAPMLIKLLKSLSFYNAITVYFPVGHYRLEQNIEFPKNVHLLFDHGAILEPMNGVKVDIPVTINAEMSLIFGGSGKVIGTFGGQAIYPQWWGAKGDKETDETHVFQHIFGLSKETNQSVTIYVPRGDYVWTDALEIHGYTSVICDAGATFWRNHTRTMLYNYEYNGTPNEGYTGNGNITFENARFEFVAFNPSVLCYENGNILQFAHASDWVFRNCEFYDVIDAHAIEINSSENVLIDTCKFYGYRELADNRWYVEAIQIDHAGTEGIQGALPYDNTHCKNIMIHNCYFGKGRTYKFIKENIDVTIEFKSWPAAIGGHTHKEGHWHKNIKIINNTFEGMRYYAIRPYKWVNTFITGNTFYKCGGGIYAVSGAKHVNFGAAQPLKQLSILDNQFIDGQSIYPEYFQENRRFAIGIYSTDIVSEDVKIEGNMISVAEDSGIIISNVDRISITNNTIKNIEKHGIELSGSSQLLINQNHLYRTKKSGIFLKTCSQINLSNNQITESDDDAIHLDQVSKLLIVNNIVKHNNESTDAVALNNDTQTGIVRDNVISGDYRHGLWFEKSVSNLAYGYQFGSIQNDSKDVIEIHD